MANENGAEKLIERILAEARQDAEAVLQQADDQAGRLNGAAQAEADAIRTAAEAKGNKIREEILERCRTNAKLDARKHILAAKRGLMEEAFDLAERRLEEMSGKERDRRPRSTRFTALAEPAWQASVSASTASTRTPRSRRLSSTPWGYSAAPVITGMGSVSRSLTMIRPPSRRRGAHRAASSFSKEITKSASPSSMMGDATQSPQRT